MRLLNDCYKDNLSSKIRLIVYSLYTITSISRRSRMRVIHQACQSIHLVRRSTSNRMKQPAGSASRIYLIDLRMLVLQVLNLNVSIPAFSGKGLVEDLVDLKQGSQLENRMERINWPQKRSFDFYTYFS